MHKNYNMVPERPQFDPDVYGNAMNNRVPVFSTLGRGPKGKDGEKGEKGDPMTIEDMSSEQLQQLIDDIRAEITTRMANIKDVTVYTDGVNTTVFDLTDIFPNWAMEYLVFVNVEGLDLSYGTDYTIVGDQLTLTNPIVHDHTRVDFRFLYFEFINDTNSYAYIMSLIGSMPTPDYNITDALNNHNERIVNIEAELPELDMNHVHAFDTVADMKLADDLKTGMICHTNGFHASGDGGAAFYEIVETATANEMDVIACGDLYAKMIAQDVVTPEMFGAYGDNTHDDTQAINRALQVAKSVKCKAASSYLVSLDAQNMAINMGDNQTLDLNNGTIALISNSAQTYGIINFDACKNSVIKNGTIIGDRDSHTGTTGEWGNGISISVSENIVVENITIKKCWGDGIYIGSVATGVHNKNVKLLNVVSDNNRRNGVSVIDCQEFFFENVTAKNTDGTAPKAGIDFEPNNSWQILTGIANNLYCLDNDGEGIGVSNHAACENIEIVINNLFTNSIFIWDKGANNSVMMNNVSIIMDNVHTAFHTFDVYDTNYYSLTNIDIDGKNTTGATPGAYVNCIFDFDGTNVNNIIFDGLKIHDANLYSITNNWHVSQTTSKNIKIRGFMFADCTIVRDLRILTNPNNENSIEWAEKTTPMNIECPISVPGYNFYDIVGGEDATAFGVALRLPGEKILVRNKRQSTNHRITRPTTRCVVNGNYISSETSQIQLQGGACAIIEIVQTEEPSLSVVTVFGPTS